MILCHIFTKKPLKPILNNSCIINEAFISANFDYIKHLGF